jgi:hypothetical protein
VGTVINDFVIRIEVRKVAPELADVAFKGEAADIEFMQSIGLFELAIKPQMNRRAKERLGSYSLS